MSSVSIFIPDLPESVADATVATWHKKPSDAVCRDEVLIEIETDKVALEILASVDGIPDAVLEDEGTTVTPRQILGRLREGSSTGKGTSAKPEEKDSTPAQRQQASLTEQNNDALNPAIRRLLGEHNLEASAINGTGAGGRITREDVGKHSAKAPAAKAETKAPAATSAPQAQLDARGGKRIPTTRLCKRVAERLPEVKNPTAVLTTFNEVNTKPIMDLRKQYGDTFEKRHGIRLGFMSFYVKAVVEVLEHYPEVNASIDGDDVVYHNYLDVSMAVPTSRGPVTPVLRDVGLLGMADIEKNIKELIVKGRDGRLTVEDLTGGDFTITNGGVFGSLMSTSIIDPSQSAILDMYATKDHPMTVDGKAEILSTMYLALSYDHRLIDGRESVGFLVIIRELLEDPTRLLLDVQLIRVSPAPQVWTLIRPTGKR